MAKKKTDEPKKQRFTRLKQIKDAYVQTQKVDKKLTPIMLGILIGIIGAFVAIGMATGFGIFWIPIGVMLALMVAIIVLGRRVEKAAYSQIEGQPGAAGAALTVLKRGWKTTPAIAITRNQDVVHRVVGTPGVILIGEGAPNRVKHLLAAERKKHARVAGGASVHELVVGNGEGEIPIRRLSKHIMKMDRELTGAQVTDLLNRIKAIDASQPKMPIPKGPMPTNARQAMRAARQATKGR